jgi:acetyl esterase/lipase
MNRLFCTLCALLTALCSAVPVGAASSPATEVIALWPGTPPVTEYWTGPETVQTLPFAGNPIRMIGNVTTPTLTVYRPKPGTGNGTAVIVIPGGGFQALAPDRIGMIGFSAGAITTMGVVMIDSSADRPSFAAPIYGAMDNKTPPADAPPLFIAVTEDDPAVPATESMAIFARWNAALLPAELHVYEKGGHGFGMMHKGLPVDGWTAAYEAWLRSHGWLTRPEAKP